MDRINLQQLLPALSTLLAIVASLGLAAGLVGCGADDGASSGSSAVSASSGSSVPSDGSGSSASSGASSTSDQTSSAEQLTVQVHEVHPFDETSFTQGLELDDDSTLLVGTGMEGESRIYRTTLDGEELASADLDPEFFGEGITRYGDHIWQLTWQDGVAIKRDADTLEEIDRTSIEGEGWGLCSRDDEIILSDGTSQLRRMDPDTLEERERFDVTLDGRAVSGLNELECVGDEIYANIFTETTIVRIDATTGEVTGVIDASSLENNATPDPNHVLNGIAHIPGTDRFLLAGKRWPELYEVSFVPAGSAS